MLYKKASPPAFTWQIECKACWQLFPWHQISHSNLLFWLCVAWKNTQVYYSEASGTASPTTWVRSSLALLQTRRDDIYGVNQSSWSNQLIKRAETHTCSIRLLIPRSEAGMGDKASCPHSGETGRWLLTVTSFQYTGESHTYSTIFLIIL